MHGRNRGLVFGVTVAALVFQAGPARAWSYHDPAHHFTIELPAGWVAMSARDLKIRTAIARQMVPGCEPAFAAGFYPPVGKPSSRPCVLVQVDADPTTGKSFDEFRESFEKDFAAIEKHKNLDARARMGGRLLFAEPHFEADRKRYVGDLRSGGFGKPSFDSLTQGELVASFEVIGRSLRSGEKAPDPGARPAAGASYGYFGPDRLVILHCLFSSSNGPADGHPLTQIADSFRFDDLTPPDSAEGAEPALSPETNADKVRRVALALAAGGGALAVVGLPVVVLRRLRSARSVRSAGRYAEPRFVPDQDLQEGV